MKSLQLTTAAVDLIDAKWPHVLTPLLPDRDPGKRVKPLLKALLDEYLQVS